ncbi:hypothetical protein [Acinetobacter venetianus]|uniref:hypothetical protein n=1 Tax=Acinetobacter venetianus TaxID=52133 RepID=UPI0028972828|nr:hypothetical protein [Acinetobacter venetianus]
MLKRKLILCSLLSVLLTGCGGGGDSGSSSGNNSDPASTQEKVSVDLYSVSYQEDEDHLYTKKYSFVDNVVKDTEFYTPLSEEDYLLTEDTLYTDTWVAAKTKAISALNFYFSDAPKTGYYNTYKKINLSGENVFERFYPSYKVMFDKFGVPEELENSKVAQAYNRIGPLFFPQGSYCYQVQEEKTEKPYITFSKSGMTEDNYAEVIDQLENQYKTELSKVGHTYKVNTGKWKGYSWRYYREYDAYGQIFDFVVINYNGKLVFGDMNHFENVRLTDVITQHTQRLNAMNSSTFIEAYYAQKAVLEELNKHCSWFNEAATDTILKL